MKEEKIVFGSSARKKLVKGAKALADAVRITMGPKGKNVLIEKPGQPLLITNDGVTIAKNVLLASAVENMGARLVREVCMKTNELAGDGTTTACVLAEKMIERGIAKLRWKENPLAVRRGMEKMTTAVCAALKSSAQKITTEKQLAQVANISCGDEEIGALVAKAFHKVGENGVVSFTKGNLMKSTLSFVEGYQFEKGLVSPNFVSDAKKMCCEMENARVLCLSGNSVSFSNLVPLFEKVFAAGEKMIVVLSELNDELVSALVVNKIKLGLPLCVVQVPFFGEAKTEILKDVAALTGATIVEDGNDEQCLGRVKKFVATKDATTMIASSDKLFERIEVLKAQLSTMPPERNFVEKRLALLSDGIAMISVGGTTDIEVDEKILRVEDAVMATKAAMEEGVVAGGGSAFLKAHKKCLPFLKKFKGGEKVGGQIVLDAILAPAMQIISNSGVCSKKIITEVMAGTNGFGYNALTNKFCNMLRSGITDPAKVPLCALKNATSVVGTLLTTDVVIKN